MCPYLNYYQSDTKKLTCVNKQYQNNEGPNEVPGTFYKDIQVIIWNLIHGAGDCTCAIYGASFYFHDLSNKE